MQYSLDCGTMLLSAVLCFYFLYGKYPIRSAYMGIRIALLLAAIAARAVLLALQISPLNFISGCGMILLVIRLLFFCNKKALFLYASLFAMLTLSADVLGVITVSAFHQNTISVTLGASELVWQHHIWNWIILIILTRIAKVLILQKERLQIRWHEIIFYVLVVLFEVGIFAYISYAIQASSSGIVMLLIMVGFLLLDLYIIYVFHKMSQLREKERQTDLMHQHQQLQLQMYRELQNMYQKTCETAHDINRHITSLKTWIAETSTRDAEQYLSDLSAATKQLRPRIQNQNKILEIILNTVATRCESENIQFDMEVEDFSLQFLSEMDITTIFSNLLDNAVDACMEVENGPKQIKMVLCQNLGLVALRIANTCNKPNHVLPRRWHSTKENHMGLGLSNVEKAVEKYHGVVSYQMKQKRFQVSVTLPLEKKIPKDSLCSAGASCQDDHLT